MNSLSNAGSGASAEARQLYTDLVEHSDLVGAYAFVSEDDEKQYRFRERELEITADCTVDEEVLDFNDHANNERGRLLIHVPSAWHAAISLSFENRSWLGGRYGKLHQPLIFRGQSDSRWSITSSFQRCAELTPEFKQSWIYTFVDLVERVLSTPQHGMTEWMFPGDLSAHYDPSGTNGPGGKAHHVATAQHFGIPTPFLDFTTDPSVAVWFACKDAERVEAPLASVFAVPLLFLGRESGLLVPHPYVSRLYRQRGIVAVADGGRIRRLSVEVRFPPDPSFKVLRHQRLPSVMSQHERIPSIFDRDWQRASWPQRPRQSEVDGEVDLLSEDSWWVQLASTARNLVENGRLEELKTANWLNLHEFIGDLAISPQFMRMDHKSMLVRQSAIDHLDMLLTLTTEMQGGTPRVLPNLVSYCVNANPRGLRAMMPTMREVLEACPEDWPVYLAGTSILNSLDAALRDPRLPT